MANANATTLSNGISTRYRDIIVSVAFLTAVFAEIALAVASFVSKPNYENGVLATHYALISIISYVLGQRAALAPPPAVKLDPSTPLIPTVPVP